MTAPHRGGVRGMAATLRSVLNFRPIELDPVARRLRGAANVDDLRRLAKRRLPRGVFDYIDGAAEDERTMAANRAGFADLTFCPRVLTGVGEPDPSTTLLGETIPLPLVVAPTGFTRLAHSEGELAVARAAARAGLPYTLSTLGTYSIEDVAAVNDASKWFQVYVFRDRGLVRDMVQRAAAAGYRAIMPTVDTAVFGRRERDVRRGFSLPAQDRTGHAARRRGAPGVDVGLRARRADPLRQRHRATADGEHIDGTTAITLAEYVNAQFDSDAHVGRHRLAAHRAGTVRSW